MEENKSTAERDLGLQLHGIQTSIHLGREAIAETIARQPVDLATLEQQRAKIHADRLARNAVRAKLEAEKRSVPRPLPKYRWV